MLGVAHWIGAETAAFAATALAVGAALPQLRRVTVGRDVRGVSIVSPMFGIGTELAWTGYAMASGLWSALPEAVLMAASNVALVLALARRGVVRRRAVVAGALWLALLVALAAWGGLVVLAAALAGSYALQAAPAVWSVWTTRAPTGVAAATWVLVGIEGALWGVYGMHHHDPATSWLATIAVAAAVVVLGRKVVTCRGRQRSPVRARAAAGAM